MTSSVGAYVRHKFEVDGYYVWEDVISDSHAEKLRSLICKMADYENQIGESYFYPFDTQRLTQRVWNLVNKSQCFVDLLETDILMDMMEFIFMRPTKHPLFFLSSFQANILNPGVSRQKLHMDTPFPDPIPPWPAKANSIWLLDDFTEDNGATEVVAGSHKFARKPSMADTTLDTVKVIAPKGSVIFTHGNLWHRAGANTSNQARVALLCSFAASFMREIACEEDQSLVVCEDLKRRASERVRTLLAVGHGIKNGSHVKHEEADAAKSIGHNPSV